MRKEEVINELLKSANENGLIETLYGVFGKSVKASVSFSTKACDTSIDDVEFSPRAEHSLKRAGVFTIGGVIDLITDDALLRIRNLGKKTQNEIKTFGYDRLTDAEKKRFSMISCKGIARDGIREFDKRLIW